MKKKLQTNVTYYTGFNWLIIFLFLTLPFLLPAQIQIGSAILGEANNDVSGSAVAISGDGLTVAIGAYGNDGGANNGGHVRIYRLISGSWTKLGSDIDGTTQQNYLGWAVSLSSDGNTVAIGIPQATSKGTVRVYAYNGSSWVKQGGDIVGETNGDKSGESVSISSDGTTVAIGARFNDGAGSNAGHVRVYKIISGTWTKQGNDIDGEAASDNFGECVSLSSNGLAVAVGASQNGGGRGHVRIYNFISNSWVQQGSDIDGEGSTDRFGYTVSLSASGDYVAIGAPNNSGGGTLRGHTRIYKLQDAVWTQQGSDIDGITDSESSGTSVSIAADGQSVAIGAPFFSSSTGAVRLYQFSNNSWSQQGTNIEGTGTYDEFGGKVSFSSNGLRVIGGAIDQDGGNYKGYVKIYKICGENSKLPVQSGNTFIGSYTTTDADGYTHYCTESDSLLVSLLIGSSGAVVNADEVELKTGRRTTYGSSGTGGLVLGASGYIMIDRRWSISPSQQPTSGSVGIKYYFTNQEFEDLSDSLANLASPVEVSHPRQIQMYTNNSGTFPDPHTVSGSVLNHSNDPSTTEWVWAQHGTDNHSAEYFTSVLYGGGAGSFETIDALPVKLVRFNAKPRHKDIILDWSTALELNNDHFEIERSFNGKDYFTIGSIKGVGNSFQLVDYQFTDYKILNYNHQVIYYRLKQVDYNGDYEYSNPIEFNSETNNALTQLKASPNPFSNHIMLSITNSKQTQVKVLNNFGVIIYENHQPSEFENIDTSQWKAGMYIIQMESSNTTKFLRMVKQN